MKCPKCGSEDVNIEFVQEQTMKQKRKGVIYWVLIGWWWEPILWIFLTLPMLIIAIFRPTKYKIKTKSRKTAICQSCGHSWKVK